MAGLPADQEGAKKVCESCRRLLSDEDNDGLADLLGAHHPNCGCHAVSVGQGSPGVVGDDEVLHRIIASPRDYDPEIGIAAKPFEKVFSNGLSVWRAGGPDQDIQTLLEEALHKKSDGLKKRVFAICTANAGELREMKDANGSSLFCVYDQTVSRLDSEKPPVGTHAGIFLRHPPKGTTDRKRVQKDHAGRLREAFLKAVLPADDYREGLCRAINERADAGDFDRD
jgi:hypothetical protein